MKPPPFAYHRPGTTDEAVGLLGRLGTDGKVLAGGQSLIPLLNMRLARPGALVDITGLDELDTVEVEDGAVRVGAAVTAGTLEDHAEAVGANPVLGQAVRLVAHRVIRTRGTVVGSLAHADPAAELPAVLVLLGGRLEVRGPDGSRTIPAGELYRGPMESTLAPDELATHAVFPVPSGRSGTAVVESARRHGDYALAGAAVHVGVAGDGTVAVARAALFGVGPVPVRCELSDALAGRPADSLDPGPAFPLVEEAVRPQTDIHATAAYRRYLAGVLTGRALRRAAAAATGGAPDGGS